MGARKDFEVYGDLLLQHRPTIRSLIYNILYKKFLEKNKAKESFYNNDIGFSLPEEYMPYTDLQYLAIVKNKKVVEVIRVNTKTAKIFKDKKIEFIPFDPKQNVVKIDMSYEDGSFIEKEELNEKD